MHRHSRHLWLALVTVAVISFLVVSPGHAGSATAADPFPAFKARMVKLFKDCSYVNLFVPHHQLAGVNPREEGKEAWLAMLQEVERGDRGWALSRTPEAIQINCEDDRSTGHMVEVYYLGGMVGVEGAPVSVKVGPAFRTAIDQLVVIAEKREAEWRARPENPDSWPVNTDQARALASAFVKAAGLESGGHMRGSTEPAANGGGPRHPLEFPGIARLVIDGQDGSILRAVNLLAAPRGPCQSAEHRPW